MNEHRRSPGDRCGVPVTRPGVVADREGDARITPCHLTVIDVQATVIAAQTIQNAR